MKRAGTTRSEELTESRYGTFSTVRFASLPAPPPALAAARAAMTRPSVVKLLLIKAPSLSLVPVAPVAFARSLPARSTSEMRETFSPTMSVVVSWRFCVKRSVNTACERDDVSFMFVAATVRACAKEEKEKQTQRHQVRKRERDGVSFQRGLRGASLSQSIRDRTDLGPFVHEMLNVLKIHDGALAESFDVRSERGMLSHFQRPLGRGI